MPQNGSTDLTESVAHLLGRVGAATTERYARAVAADGVRPKHVGLLTALARRGSTAQLDLARLLDVAPSLVVGLADDLEDRGAIERRRDPADRRRQLLDLTPAGRLLLRRCTSAADRVGEEVTASLSEAEREHLRQLLHRMFTDLGLDPPPPQPPPGS